MGNLGPWDFSFGTSGGTNTLIFGEARKRVHVLNLSGDFFLAEVFEDGSGIVNTQDGSYSINNNASGTYRGNVGMFWQDENPFTEITVSMSAEINVTTVGDGIGFAWAVADPQLIVDPTWEHASSFEVISNLQASDIGFAEDGSLDGVTIPNNPVVPEPTTFAFLALSIVAMMRQRRSA